MGYGMLASSGCRWRSRGTSALFVVAWISVAQADRVDDDVHNANAPSFATAQASTHTLAAQSDPNTALSTTGMAREADSCERGKAAMRFTLAHFNDTQARYSDQLAGKSRFGYLAGYLRSVKAETSAALVLDAGDDYEKGSIAELRSMGESTRQMIQSLPIDVRTIGNHDFSYGEAAVLRDIAKSKHPVLAANIQHKDGTRPFAPYASLTVGCVRVGVIGLVTGNYGADDRPSNDPFDGVFIQDSRYEQILTEQVQAHRSEVDVLIALTHIGYWTDVALAQKVPGIDIFVGGHSEDTVRVPDVVRHADGRTSWVMQAGHYVYNIGRADFMLGTDGRLTLEHYRMVDVDHTLPFADDVQDLATALENQYAPDSHRTIATVKADIHVGKPMADLVWRAVQDQWHIDGLIIGSDVFWEGLVPGPLTLQRLFNTVLVQREPAGTSGYTSLYTVSLTGAEVAAIRQKFQWGSLFLIYLPVSIDPARLYRFAIEKRVLEIPTLAFSERVRWPAAQFGGELIDPLEAYARAQTAAGLPIDSK